MEEKKANLKNLLARYTRGLTLAQLDREYGRKFGPERVDIQSLLKELKTDIRSEKAAWGDTLYFLDAMDSSLPLVTANGDCDRPKVEPLADGGPRRSYSPDDQVKQLQADAEAILALGSRLHIEASRVSPSSDIRTVPGHCPNPVTNESSEKGGVKNVEKIVSKEYSERGPGIENGPRIENENGHRLKNENAMEDGRSREIYVSDLPLDFDEIDLEEIFLGYDVRRIRLTASRNKRCAFVELGSLAEVEEAMNELCDDKKSWRHYCKEQAIFVQLTPRDHNLRAKFTSNTKERAQDAYLQGPQHLIPLKKSPPSCHQPLKIVGDGDSGTVSSNSASGSACDQVSRLSISADPPLRRCKHATTRCKNYPNCRPNCDFQHPLCSRGIYCDDRFCSYDHPHRSKKCHLCIKQSQTIPDVLFTECEHRSMECDDFPKCPYGFKCSFLHPRCSKAGCVDWEKCPYEHEGQRKVCYICIKAMNGNESAIKEAKIRTNDSKGGPVLLKENVPCQYDVKCWTPQCPYKHPPEWNRKACPWGRNCRREKCSFLHPPVT